MKFRFLSLLLGALLSSLVLAPAFAWGATVSVRVEGTSHTLVGRTVVTLGTGSFDKDGNPAHSCTSTSAAGALEAATHGSWSGSWSDGLGYFVSKIRGETHSGSPDFFTFWRNHRLASTGICQTDLEQGDDLLFFVDHCDFDAASGACANKSVLPLEVRIAKKESRDGRTVVTVVAYSTTGKTTPVARASVLRNGVWLGKTDKHGRFRVRLSSAQTFRLTAIKRGYARSAPVGAKLGR